MSQCDRCNAAGERQVDSFGWFIMHYGDQEACTCSRGIALGIKRRFVRFYHKLFYSRTRRGL